VSADQCTVASGATLKLATGAALTVNDGSDPDLMVNGTLQLKQVRSLQTGATTTLSGTSTFNLTTAATKTDYWGISSFGIINWDAGQLTLITCVFNNAGTWNISTSGMLKGNDDDSWVNFLWYIK
jgi:hypothetical protein